MNRRPGATLIEVLVAIFVTSIGLLALLALFPLGAINMAQAIKESRSATAAANGAALSEVFQVRNDPNLFSAAVPDAYLNPNGGAPLPNLNTFPGYDTSSSMLGPSSYPVYVDYVGKSVLGSGTIGGLSPGITRVSPSFIGSLSQFYRYCGLLDDITFDPAPTPAAPIPPSPNGTPWIPTGGSVEREDRYTWAYMLRRPRAFATSVVDCSVVVYSGRPLSVLGETAYAVDFTVNQINPASTPPFQPSPGTTNNIVNLTWGAGTSNPTLGHPNIRNGSWILDATVLEPGGIPDPHGTFYRVVNITDTGSNSATLELQTNIRQNSAPNATGQYPPPGTIYPLAGNGVLIVMENVVEVFEKGSGWRP